MRSFFDRFISADEAKVSTLVIVLIGMVIFTCVQYSYMGDISSNLSDIVQALVYALAGINVADHFAHRG